MRHADEGRNADDLRRLRAREAMSDPEALYRQYEGMVARDKRHKATVAVLEKRIASLEREVQAARQHQDADLRRRLASAHGALEAYRAETRRLKADLRRVRGSNAMRIGKAVLSPLHTMRRASKRPDASGSPATGKAASLTTAGATAGSAASTALASTSPTRNSDDQRSLDQLRREFDDDRSGKRFLRVVNRLWYSEGTINDVARFIEAHRDVADTLSGKDRDLIERVRGEHRLLHRGVTVPPRARGVAYVSEPGRVLYCAHSTPLFNSNGYSTRTRGVAAGLRANGADVVVVARPGYPWDSATDIAKPAEARFEQDLDEVPYVHLPGLSLTRAPLDHYLQVAADAFVREARRQRPEVIHAASNHRTALPALIAARRLGVPFVYEVRGLWEITNASDKPGWERTEQYLQMVKLETLVAREADIVLAITRQVADELQRRGVDRERIQLAPNAVDTEQFAPIPKDEAYAKTKGIRTDVPVIGFAGSMVPYEGLEVLLEASAVLDARGVGHQVVLAGSGGSAAELKEMRDEKNLGAVMFLGRLPADEMPRLLSTFDIMPIPRLSNRVTELVSPLKPLEAFSMMKPVVLSDVAPHRDLADAGERGLLVAPGDPEALADALELLISNRDRAMDFARAARQWTLLERTWRQLGAQMLSSHRDAAASYAASAQDGPTLRELRVGLIADEFTTKTLAATVDVVTLHRDRWREQLKSDRLDLVFIESAWSGNQGAWRRGVGHYTDEESSDLAQLLEQARVLGIPSVFWNKEDPVHFGRFRRNARLCDHVFTTDAEMIPGYLSTPDAVTRTAASLGFYAQPRIHNPLPAERAFSATVAYAGTYYGERYAERSQRLARMLNTARPFGLTIYDRQASNADSPYRFPPDLAPFIAGSLTYDEVIDAYKTHTAHINVNSVEGSPSMFSRRVVEIAGCGGIVLSSASRGMVETFGSAIASTDDAGLWRAMLRDWTSDPVERIREAWLQMRVVYRAHTAETAIAILARTAGVPVRVEVLPSYGVVVNAADTEALEGLESQSLRPSHVWIEGGVSRDVRDRFATGVVVQEAARFNPATVAYVGRAEGALARTHFEDLLHATRFGDWSAIHWKWAANADSESTLARPVSDDATQGLVRSSLVGGVEDLREVRSDGIELLILPTSAVAARDDVAACEPAAVGKPTVLVAGHDLKFATAFIEHLETTGHRVLIDEWQAHNRHDPEASLELLQQADVVFAEWGLGNAVWYSQHVRDDQRLIVRVHRQELQLPYLRRIKHDRVEAFLFVGELVKRAAITSHGVPPAKAVVVPNFVDVEGLARPKHRDSEHTLGMVGIVPQMKRLDLAVALLKCVKDEDARFTLRIKGRQPHEYGWMQQRPAELAYYERVYREIDALNSANPGSVVFDPHGDDMAEWYRNIGFAISVSDYESFHFTIADGAASGAVPVTLGWAGAEYLYPASWIEPSIDRMAASILRRRGEGGESRDYIREHYAQGDVLRRLTKLLVGP